MINQMTIVRMTRRLALLVIAIIPYAKAHAQSESVRSSGSSIAIARQARLWAERSTILLSSKTITVEPRAGVVTLTLTNPTDSVARVQLATSFGETRTFEDGMSDILLTGPGPMTRSLTSWLGPLPAEIQLQPHEARTLTIKVAPPTALADGTYWGFLLVRQALVNIAPVASIPRQSVVLLVSRKGAIHEDITIDSLAVVPVSSFIRGLCLTSHAAGPADALLGAMTLSLQDSVGRPVPPETTPTSQQVAALIGYDKVPVWEYRQVLALSAASRQRVCIALPQNLAAGSYQLVFEFRRALLRKEHSDVKAESPKGPMVIRVPFTN